MPSRTRCWSSTAGRRSASSPSSTIRSARRRSPRSPRPSPIASSTSASRSRTSSASGPASPTAARSPSSARASPFLTARALEQIKVDAAYSAANVKLVGVSSGVAYGELGPTHHSIEDVAWTRAIDGLVVVVPADPIETGQAIRAAYELPGPHLHPHQPHARAHRAPRRLRLPHRRGRAAARGQ